MGDPWGIGGFRGGGGSPILSKSSKKKSVKKSEKSAKSKKKIGKNQIFFVTENGLKCIRNRTKHFFKSQKSVKKNIKSAKPGKNRILQT